MLFILACFHTVRSQSCCSGGVPISSNLGLPLADAKTIQLFVGYDWNIMNTLKSGTEKLEDNTRKRTTHTAMMQVGYTLNNKFSFDVMLPYVRQERKLSPIGLDGTFDATNGIGDVVLLAKYQFIKNYQLGIGVKFPTGSTEEKNSLGLPMNADMQPGSGSWDFIYWFSGIQNIKFRPSSSIGLIATYRATGENDEYFGSQVYGFGNELQSIFTIADQVLIGNLIINPSIGIKYRKVQSDTFNDNELPSTGGSWLFFRPGLGYEINQNMNFQFTTDIPIYANLTGTQVTPTIRLNFSFYIKLATSKSE